MANSTHLYRLKAEVEEWNRWRARHPLIVPDLSGADLSGADLHDADLHDADLRDAILFQANLNGADLGGADLSEADLSDTDLSDALLFRARLIGTRVIGADLRGADLSDAILFRADLSGANLSSADLRDAILFQANLKDLTFDDRTIWPGGGFNPPISKARETPDQGFTISFHPDLSPEQIKVTLEALADYFRECGGAGLRFNFEFQALAAGEPKHVGR